MPFNGRSREDKATVILQEIVLLQQKMTTPAALLVAIINFLSLFSGCGHLIREFVSKITLSSSILSNHLIISGVATVTLKV